MYRQTSDLCHSVKGGVAITTNTRTKRQNAQAERSRRTRSRIVAAATALFLRDGYVQTTMSAIAEEAGVAYQTLYISYRGKVALLATAFDIAVAGDDEPVPVLDRGWRQQLRDEPEGSGALRIFIDVSQQIIERVHPLYAAMVAASADPDVAAELARNKALRYETYTTAMRDIALKPGFNPHLSVERASQILYAIASEETYGLLVAENHWSPHEWTRWVTRTATTELFPPGTTTSQDNERERAGHARFSATAR